MTRAVKTVTDRTEATPDPALIDALIAAATVDTPTNDGRQTAADTVFDIAGGDPDVLQQARIVLQKRLAHRSDDFAAGRGLRTVRRRPRANRTARGPLALATALRDEAPPQLTPRSLPSQYGARSSRLRTFIAPDNGSGSVRNSTDLGIL